MHSVDHRQPVSLLLDPQGLDEQAQRHLYDQMVLARLVEEKSLNLLRQGRLSKWFSGIGQEAIAVGLVAALSADDFILPLHRNLGVFTGRDLPLSRLFAQWQGKSGGYTQGRDRSFHFGAPENYIVGMISHLGAMLGVADGLALAARLEGSGQVVAVFSGDGGSSQGDFHEAVNLAAVWDLPVIFLIENNGYGLSTPSAEQYRCERFVDKAVGYGIDGFRIDGNDVFAVVHAVREVAAGMRTRPRPLLLEAMTFRMRGHEEASGVRYVPEDLLDLWAKRDPVVALEKALLERGVLNTAQIARLRTKHQRKIDDAWEEVFAMPDPEADSCRELGDVYAPSSCSRRRASTTPQGPVRRLVDAISMALVQAMEEDPGLVVMGQDIADYGGVFKVTAGLLDRFGPERVRNTPLCESAVLGAALGLAVAGRASVIEMQFADFVSCGFNQLVNNLAKTYYRWGQPVNVTVRLPTGAGVGAGPFHSQSTEAWFTHVPGLKVVYPATAADAKGLLLASIRDPNPVLFFEHKKLYRSVEGAVDEEALSTPIGEAAVPSCGDSLTVVTYGSGVHWAMSETANRVGIEVIDLRSLLPWDRERVFESVRKTSRCLVLHEDTRTGGFGAEIAAEIGEVLFDDLDAPVMRVGALDTPVPFARSLEDDFLPTRRLSDAIEKILKY